MADSRGQGSNRPAPVKVYYFRKPSRPGRAGEVVSADASPTLEIPVAQVEDAARDAKPRRARGARSTPRERPAVAEPVSEPVTAPGGDSADEPTAAARAHAQLAKLVDPQALRNLSEKQIAELAIYGHHLFETGKLDEARVVFESLVGFGVKDAFPHTMLGTVYLAQGEPKLALALFEASLELDPNDVAARVYRGEIRLMENRPADAIEDLGAAVEQGDDADPFVERARTLLKSARAQLRKKRPK